MKKRMVKLLSLALSGMLTLSSLGSMTVFAAPEEDFGDKLDEQFEAEDEAVEDEEISLSVETEDIENVEVSVEELVPPVDVKWDKPGVFSFKVASDKPMFYAAELYRNGRKIGTIPFKDLSSKYGERIIFHCEYNFESPGEYSVKVYVAANDSKDAERVYGSEASLNWVYPDLRLDTPGNPRWESINDEKFAIATCDPVEHAYGYSFLLIKDGKGGDYFETIKPYADVSKFVGDCKDHEYSFKVTARSDDLSMYASSYSSKESSPLSLNESSNSEGTKDLVPPTSIKWDGPGWIKFYVSDTPMMYIAEVGGKNENGDVIPGATFYMGDLSQKYANQEVRYYVGQAFKESGTYKVMVGVYQEDNTERKYYSDSQPTLEWTAPEEKVSAPTNLHWEKINDTQFVVAACDPVDHAYKYDILLYEDGEYKYTKGEYITETKKDVSDAIGDLSEHEYTFDVWVYSDDLTKYANNFDSEKSPIYSPDTVITPSEIDVPDGPAPRIIVNTDGTSKVYQNGVEIQNYTGLAMIGTEDVAPWVYVENNKRNESFSGFVDYDGETFYVAGGTMATNLNGLQVDPSNGKDWYFLAGGQVQKHHEGLALYNGEWFYIKDGRLDTNLNAYVDYNGGKFFVGAGRIIQEYNGLAQDPQNTVNGDWYFLANGQAQTQYTGLAFYDNAWFYVINGKLATDYTGNVEYDGSTFYVENGMVM
ncbi:MAG: hypothetical protein K6B69_16580 [Lachnospiraceae bacterium]|nr:hypothetical protein [Lachnospiraceae bacterium]